MKKDSVALKFRTQNLVATYTLNFEDKFEVLSKVHFRYTIYSFKAQEVRSPTLRIVCKLELK